MWNTFVQKLKLVFTDKKLRGKIIFVLFAILLFRLLATIPVPGVDEQELARFFSSNQFFGLLNLFSGGGLAGLSVVMLGVGPYITASIIMQLMTIMSPKIKEMYHEDGQAGKLKFAQYSRMLMIPLAIIQAIGFLMLLQQNAVIDVLTTFEFATNVIVITAGSVLLMWIGELVSEFGIGNGLSLIIFAGIVSGLPNALQQMTITFDATQIPTLIAFVVVAIVVTMAVVIITEAERPIPIAHSRTAHGGGATPTTYLPIRINQAGVMPIIFALSILLLPQMIVTFLANAQSATIQSIATAVNNILQNQLYYGILYFVLVVLFTFFYTAVTFEPDTVAKNLQRSGAFIPGVRPGESTSRYVGNVVTRVTLVGALFLGIIAILPLIVQSFLTGVTSLTIGGTGLLIAVSVVIDLIKKTEGQITMREY